MTGTLPRIAVTMGDPCGIGPEVVVRAWTEPYLHTAAQLTAVGSSDILREAARRWSPQLQVVEVQIPPPAASPTLLPVLAAAPIAFRDVAVGQISAAAGEASYQAVVKSARVVLTGAMDGMVTCPINKAAWHAAGHRVPGHTELLGEVCGHRPSAMMLYLPPGAGAGDGGLGVVHVTLHCSVRQALEQLSTSGIVQSGHLLHQTLCRLGRAGGFPQSPRIGVCALNPHAGEEGLFGDEEMRLIAPAVSRLATEGVRATGPFPADTLLARAVAGEFDGVVAMLHDQGHIALKLLNMHGAVNVTLGLPICRTSVAHGTAFDIAWQGRAQLGGMLSAIQTCARLVETRPHP